MIDRYSVYSPAAELGLRFKTAAPTDLQSHFNAGPTQLLPVITHTSPLGFSSFYWGTSPKWSRDKPVARRLINTEAEVVLEKAGSRTALHSRRCLVPANSYFDWKRISKTRRVPYRILTTDRPIISFAGLWEEYEEDDRLVHTFSIVTVPANPLLQDIGNRMPAILSEADEKVWMSGDSTIGQLLRTLVPYPESLTSFHPVSNRINTTREDNRQMIEPTQPIDQFGNYGLFG